jgi:hypothetical protein
MNEHQVYGKHGGWRILINTLAACFAFIPVFFHENNDFGGIGVTKMAVYSHVKCGTAAASIPNAINSILTLYVGCLDYTILNVSSSYKHFICI